MADLVGESGELRMIIHVTRAATGETETHEIIGKVMADGADALNDRS